MVFVRLGFLFAYLVVIVGGTYGWVLNIIAILNIEEFVLSGKIVLAVIGIFVAPLGSIMGLFVW